MVDFVFLGLSVGGWGACLGVGSLGVWCEWEFLYQVLLLFLKF